MVGIARHDCIQVVPCNTGKSLYQIQKEGNIFQQLFSHVKPHVHYHLIVSAPAGVNPSRRLHTKVLHEIPLNNAVHIFLGCVKGKGPFAIGGLYLIKSL